MKVATDTFYVGVDDREITLFEGQYSVEQGMCYNSYIIKDEKTVVMDSVDRHFTERWLENIDRELNGAAPDYLLISHMEPDHSGSIAAFVKKYPSTVIVGNTKTFILIDAFFEGLKYQSHVVANGDTLSLGKHQLSFIFAPMVHWPEVMMTYDAYSKTLFSADAFGKFGVMDADKDDWACEARRYYFGIVGKFGVQVQSVLKKAAALDIEVICPLHGPVLSENLSYYLGLYDTWSQYKPEKDGVAIAYCTVYGNTKRAALDLKEKLTAAGKKAEVFELNTCDMAEAVEGAFEYSTLVLAATTYNGEVFPKMKEFILSLTERNYQNRRVAFIENGSWAPMAKKVMRAMLDASKNLEFVEQSCTIKSGYKAINEQEIAEMAKALLQ